MTKETELILNALEQARGLMDYIMDNKSYPTDRFLRGISAQTELLKLEIMLREHALINE